MFDLVSHSTNRERERKRESERAREKVVEAQVRDQQIDTHVTPSVVFTAAICITLINSMISNIYFAQQVYNNFFKKIITCGVHISAD